MGFTNHQSADRTSLIYRHQNRTLMREKCISLREALHPLPTEARPPSLCAHRDLPSAQSPHTASDSLAPTWAMRQGKAGTTFPQFLPPRLTRRKVMSIPLSQAGHHTPLSRGRRPPHSARMTTKVGEAKQLSQHLRTPCLALQIQMR